MALNGTRSKVRLAWLVIPNGALTFRELALTIPHLTFVPRKRASTTAHLVQALSSAICLIFFSVCAQAQPAAHFSGTISTVGNGFGYPDGVAVDSAGDVFVADTGNSFVKEIVAVNGVVSSSSNVNTIGSGFDYPQGVAVDSAGNVFVADTGGGAVKEIVAVNGVVSSSSTVNVVGSGFTHPAGVAVDASGDVFVADYQTNAVYEIVAVSGAVSSSSTVNTIGSNFNGPEGVAVDANGNVFVADTSNNAVKEIVAVSGAVSSSSTVTTVGSDFEYPFGVAVDGSGNVFVVDRSSNPLHEIVAVSGAVSSSSTVNDLGSGFYDPDGLAVDSHGDIFLADTFNTRVAELQLNSVNFGSLPVATSTPTTLTLTFTIDTGGTISGPTVLTEGVTGLDFTDAGTGSCTMNGSDDYEEGDTCTVDVTFTPTQPGLRYGAVTLSSEGTTIATTYVYGTGIGPQVAFAPATLSTLASSFTDPLGVATDSAGNVFVADVNNNAVKEIVAVGGKVSSSSVVNTIGNGFSYPKGVAVDGAGNVFVADFNNNAVKEIVAVNGAVSSSSAVNTVGSEFDRPFGVAVDAGGDVFVADLGDNAVYEIVAVNGTVSSSSTVIPISSSFSGPTSVAVDAAGDVFVTDQANSAVDEIVAVNGAVSSSSTINTVGSGFNYPTGVAVDGNGNVYVADLLNNAVKEIVAVNGTVSSSSTVNTLGGSYSYPAGVAVDSKGNVFVGDQLNNAVKEIDVVDAPSLSFASTAVGSTSSDSPKTVTVTNNGNAPLTLEVPTTGLNPTISTGFTYGGSSTCPQLLTTSSAATLPAAASCTISISFTPTASGSITGSLVATDNALNATGPNYAKQTISLSGPATGGAISTSTALASSTLNPKYGVPVVLTATVKPTPVGTPLGTVSFYSGGTLLGTVPLNSSGTATLSIDLPLGSNSIKAVYSGSAKYAGSTSSALSVYERADTALTLSASPNTQLYNNPIVLTAQATSPTPGTLTGTVSFLDGTSLIATVQVGTNGQAAYSVSTLADGGHSLTATYSGDSKFEPSGSAVAITVGDINLYLGKDNDKSVLPGASVSYTFPLSPLVTPKFLYDVHLTATGLPPGATYTFSPASIPAGSGSLPVTLTVQTAKGVASLDMPTSPGQRNSSCGLTALAFGLLLPLVGAKQVRKRLRALPIPLVMIFCTVISLGAMIGLNGCGAGGFYGPNTSSGNYTITVTATSANLVRTSTVKLTIR